LNEVLLDGQGGRYLALRRTSRRDSESVWSYVAKVSFPEGQAETEVHDHGDGLAPFVRGLACAWSGFEGVRDYESLEGQLLLSCRHDGLGSVVCRVTLRQPWPPEWAVEVVLEFGGGARGPAAREVEAFVAGGA